MDIKFASLTLAIAALAGLGFSQAAHAEEGRGMRFDYAPNEFPLEQATGRRGHGHIGAHNVVPSVAPGAVPKLALDPGFVSKPTPILPPPVISAVPSTSAKVSMPSMFNSILNKPKDSVPLVAAGPEQLPAFGSPTALPATKGAPALTRSTNTAIAWSHKRPPVALAAAPAFKMPATKGYGGSGYIPVAHLPGGTGTGAGSSTSTNVAGVIVSKRH